MDFRVFNLGLVDFEKSLQFQNQIFQKIKNNYFNSALILCRHYPVITMGRRGSAGNIKALPIELRNRGIHMYEIERGGGVTYHGPGQLMVYPIINLNYLKKDIHLFLRQLEEIAIDLLSDFGVKGLRHQGLTGVWIDKSRPFLNNAYDSSEKGWDNKKIASIGIGIRNWITFHGMSINIKKDDLDNFSLIKPCGMDIEMTSLETILDRNIEIKQTEEIFTHKFKDNFFVYH
ncbi:MAG: lipoyl(octanoyl) transferase [Candidatus Omnitrophota bacterium]|nr:lipoyl(octanoyl) transferase [Candidatus Omnitrophota bacterium]